MSNASDSLFQAVINDNIPLVYSLFQKGVNINSLDGNGMTPLHYAVGQDNLDMVTVLINLGNASCEVDLQEERTIADVNLKDEDGQIPLHLANGINLKIIKVLISSGSDVNSKDNLGNIPLYKMIGLNNLAVVKTMIKSGLDPNVENIKGQTLLERAVKSNYIDPNIIRVLVEAGADINHKDKNGNSYLNTSIKNKNTNIINVLKDLGAENETINETGEDISSKIMSKATKNIPNKFLTHIHINKIILSFEVSIYIYITCLTKANIQTVNELLALNSET